MFSSLGQPQFRQIVLQQIDLPPRPWRLKADGADMAALAESIKRVGLLTPILVRPRRGRYELVAGHRRYWCAKRLGWKKISAVVRNLTDAEAAEAALAENAQRLDLSVAEKAEAFHQAAGAGGAWAPEELAKRMGEGPEFAHAVEAIRGLPLILREALILRIVTLDEARVLAALEDDRRIAEALRLAREEGAGTKGLREIVERLLWGRAPDSPPAGPPPAVVEAQPEIPEAPPEAPSPESADAPAAARAFDPATVSDPPPPEAEPMSDGSEAPPAVEPPAPELERPNAAAPAEDPGLGRTEAGPQASPAEGQEGGLTEAERAALAAVMAPDAPAQAPPSAVPGPTTGAPVPAPVAGGAAAGGAPPSPDVRPAGGDPETEDETPVRPADVGAQADPAKAVRRLFQRFHKEQALDLDLLKALVVRLMRDLAQQNPVDFLDLSYRESPRRYLPRHALNVTKLALYVGKHYGLTEDDQIVLGTGALLCDVGMLKVEEGILFKASRLDAREWQRVRAHALEGSALLGRPKALWDTVARVAAEHHERVNGSGYPRGLKGTELHTYSKLVALCDTYEALTGPRVHKPPVLPREAMAAVQHEAETGALDKPLAAAFARALGAYPIGSFVQLAPGEVAQVIWANATEPAKPMVRVVVDRQGRPQAPPPIVDLTKDESAHPIKAVWPPKIG